MTDPLLVPPIPVPDPDTAPYWEGLMNGKLTLCRCDDTGKWIHPPLERSRFTGGSVHFEEVSGEGTVFSYIVVRQALVPGRTPPYVVGLVELVEQPGLRINAVIDCDPADVRIDQRVELRIADLGESGFRIPEFVLRKPAFLEEPA
jgi:uncharacterized OB-fold protein